MHIIYYYTAVCFHIKRLRFLLYRPQNEIMQRAIKPLGTIIAESIII